MSTPQFRAGNPLAPEKGAFPLDHFGECAKFKEKYLKCLQVRMFTMVSYALLLKHHDEQQRLILPRALLLRARDDDDIHIKTEGKIGREQV